MKTRRFLELCAVIVCLAAQPMGQVASASSTALVEGDGAVSLVDADIGITTYAAFRVRVSQEAGALEGSFTWSDSHGVIGPLVVIESESVDHLVVEGDRALIEARGLLNGTDMDLRIEAVGGVSPSLLVEARDNSSGVVLYKAGGPVTQGDLQVAGPVRYSDGVARGIGSIGVVRSDVPGQGIGSFGFDLRTLRGIVTGSLTYRESNPLLPGAALRPLAQISMPSPSSLSVDDSVATVAGPGFYNGRTCWITARIRDSSHRSSALKSQSASPGAAARQVAEAPEVFSIAVQASPSDATPLYQAAGALIRGAIRLSAAPPDAAGLP
ncbi:MAG: hypothetical protein IT209_12055 [Armatimonadetes bacterium]|nr:hypothetical protein [Armatimonadota bacterium]